MPTTCEMARVGGGEPDRRGVGGDHGVHVGGAPPDAAASGHLRGYSTSLPAAETSRMRAAISSGIGGISSRVTPVEGDHTRFTCNAASGSG